MASTLRPCLNVVASNRRARSSPGGVASAMKKRPAAATSMPPPPPTSTLSNASALTPRSSRPCRPRTTASAIVEARADDDIAAFDGKPRYSRVLLKLSGEALAGDAGTGVDPTVLSSVAADVAAAVAAGVEVAVVVGGGNYYRGAQETSGSKQHQSSVDRATGDYVGMLATVMNALLLQGALERAGVATRVQTAIEMRQIAEPYIRRRAMRHLERGRVVIFGAGTGNPFFTTDSAAALRAAEVGADALLKATKVDGVFDRDPRGRDGGDAVLLRSLSYADVSSRKLAVMDGTAVTLAAENGIACVVFNMRTPGHVLRALLGDPRIGTSVRVDDDGDDGDGIDKKPTTRELTRAPTVTRGRARRVGAGGGGGGDVDDDEIDGVAWRGGLGTKSDGDEGPCVGC